MDQEINRISLDLDTHLHERLVSAAMLKGVSLQEYCASAIKTQLNSDGFEASIPASQTKRRTVSSLIEVRKRIFGGIPLEGDSADFIREMRDDRTESI